LFNNELAGGDQRLVANYLLLRDPSIQKTVVELLLCARIRKDQFITARMLLDFIYCVLTGSGYLFDTIFSGGENELLAAMADFDPSILRDKELDLFVLHRKLDFISSNYDGFISEVAAKYRVGDELKPRSLVRLFYLLKRLNNNFHLKFSNSFNDAPLFHYKKVWSMHKDFDESNESRTELKKFYNNTVLLAINKYANRNAPFLTKDEFYISSHGDSDLAAEVEISISYSSISGDEFHDISQFNMHIIVNEEQLLPVPVNVNLLAMMMRVCNGFRPNKHNKNSVVLLDELVTRIGRYASGSSVLFLHNKGARIKIKENADGEIRVSGL
jgi:DNA phosphorothioation-dependent restriction protein DptF